MIRVVVNGEDRQIPPGSTVKSLLASMDLGAAPAAVELNRTLIPKARHDQQALAAGDRLEVVTLVGGG